MIFGLVENFEVYLQQMISLPWVRMICMGIIDILHRAMANLEHYSVTSLGLVNFLLENHTDQDYVIPPLLKCALKKQKLIKMCLKAVK